MAVKARGGSGLTPTEKGQTWMAHLLPQFVTPRSNQVRVNNGGENREDQVLISFFVPIP
jgi:hypothetical protein